jgi:uncharacterized protein (DUF779 family)
MSSEARAPDAAPDGGVRRVSEYWEHTHLIIDAAAGSGGLFSLEQPTAP